MAGRVTLTGNLVALVERPQVRGREVVDELRRRGDGLAVDLEDVVGRAERGRAAVQGSWLQAREVPLAGVEAVQQRVGGGDGLRRRERAVPGAVDEDLLQHRAVARLAHHAA